MKISVFVLLSIAAFMFSCKKDNDIADIINPAASMKCKVNGNLWTSISRVTTKQGNTFLINGTGSLGSDVLNITTFGISTGAYNLTTTIPVQTQFSATFTNNTGTTDSLYTAYEGTVNLTKVDTVNKKISGNFSFKAKNLSLLNKNITEGTFEELTYQ